MSGLYRESVKSLPLMRWKTIFLRRKFSKKESACLSVWTFLVMQYFCIENSDGVKRMTLTAYVLRIALDQYVCPRVLACKQLKGQWLV